MSKHIGRKQRWTQESAKHYSSSLGHVVYEQNAWYALLNYRTRAPQQSKEAVATWLSQSRRLGPFKRPRNAMVALEQEATILRNRHGEDILFQGQLWADAKAGP